MKKSLTNLKKRLKKLIKTQKKLRIKFKEKTLNSSKNVEKLSESAKIDKTDEVLEESVKTL